MADKLKNCLPGKCVSLSQGSHIWPRHVLWSAHQSAVWMWSTKHLWERNRSRLVIGKRTTGDSFCVTFSGSTWETDQWPNKCTNVSFPRSGKRPQVTNVKYITPWSRGFPKKLTGLHLVKKFPTFYGTQGFITAFTTARHLSLPWDKPTQTTLTIPLLKDTF